VAQKERKVSLAFKNERKKFSLHLFPKITKKTETRKYKIARSIYGLLGSEMIFYFRVSSYFRKMGWVGVGKRLVYD
jgi:hypothetical protein